MDKKQLEMWDALTRLDGETVLRLITNWHGLQILDDGLYQNLIVEGYIEEK